MSNASLTRFSVVKQTTPGTTPTNPAWLNLNSTGPGGGPELEEIESQTIRAGRRAAGKKAVGKKSSLQIPFETQFDSTGAFWQLLVASIQSGTPTAATTQVTGVTCAAGVPGIVGLSASGIETGITAGDFVRVRTSADVTVGYFRVYSSITGTIAVFDPASLLTVGVTTYKVKRGLKATNGETESWFSMLESNRKIDSTSGYDLFQLYEREAVDSINMTVTSRGFITGQLTTRGVGSSGFTETDPSTGTPTYTAAPSTEFLDGTNNVPMVVIGFAVVGVQSVSFGWRNNMETRTIVGDFDPAGVKSGDFRVEGSIALYYDDITELNKALLGTPSILHVIFEDAAGNALIFSFPKIRYGPITKSGQQQGGSIIWTLPFSSDPPNVLAGEEDHDVHVEAFVA